MLKVKNLNVLHPSGHELLEITFSVAKGEIVGIAGSNDSGKSLLGRVIADQSIEHQGEVIINHLNRLHEPDKTKYHLGYSPAEPVLEDYLTGYEYLDFIGSILSINPNERSKRIIKLAKEYHISSDIYRLIELLSPDQKKKLSLISSVIHNPSVLIWDEPTSHLDPSEQRAIRGQLQQLKDQKTAVIIISNDTMLLEDTTDEIIIMKNGSISMQGTLSQLKNQSGSKTKALVDILEKVSANERS